MGNDGKRNFSRVREEICFAALHYFHDPSKNCATFGVEPFSCHPQFEACTEKNLDE